MFLLIYTGPNPTEHHFQFKAFWKELFQLKKKTFRSDRSAPLRVLFRTKPGVNWRLGCVAGAPSGRTRATTEAEEEEAEEAQPLPQNDITSFSHLILCSTACWKKWPLLQHLSIVGQCNGDWWVNLAKPSVRNRDQLPPVPPYRRIKGGDTSSNHFVSSVLIRCFQFFLKA